MSISDAINNARQKISNVYNALEAKGASMPEIKSLDYMAATVNGIDEFQQTISNLNEWPGYINGDKYVINKYTGTSNERVVPYAKGIYIDTFRFDSANSVQIPPPFSEDTNVVSVNLQNVPFVKNSMLEAFRNCSNLVSVTNISPSVTDMHMAFANCSNFNTDVQVPSEVKGLTGAFSDCTSLNSSVQILGVVKNMYHTFFNCQSFNRSIQIPEGAVALHGTFYNCWSFNQDIQIPYTVSSIPDTFGYCINFQSNVRVVSEKVTNAMNCFRGTSLPKNVYIPYTYSNGVNTATFNAFVNAGYLYANGTSKTQHGVTIQDLNQYY